MQDDSLSQQTVSYFNGTSSLHKHRSGKVNSSLDCRDSPLELDFANDAAKLVYPQQNEITGADMDVLGAMLSVATNGMVRPLSNMSHTGMPN